jgi:hypothetical protein
VYEFSRAIYRDLRPFLQIDPRSPGRVERLLIAECEDTVQRMAGGYNLVPGPAAHLFARVRFLFPVRHQARVRNIAADRLQAIDATLRADPSAYGATNGRRRCRALTVQGQPCQREPQLESSYCASHRHMARERIAGAM